MSPPSPPLPSLRKNPSPTLQPPSPMQSLHIIKKTPCGGPLKVLRSEGVWPPND
ncbi:Uncharacterized protein DAT39_002882 [Clarias magur]|uniref:Uncharacterized protein n=1 Tax=Clarias magur TaxID=1594786 RepID=A0A8J4U6J1_CLAMG|nr:Uncharacterized protein DAT39_002882 [Clarias magur]